MSKQIIILLSILIFSTACSAVGEGQLPSSENSGDEVGTQEEPDATSENPATPAYETLPILGTAPQWENETWINTEEPLFLADLRGKVVLLEFWTFG